MRDTSKFPLYILSLDNLASEKFLAKRKLHHRLKLIYCSLSQRRCWIIACCCYCMNCEYKSSCFLHTFPAEHPPTSFKKKKGQLKEFVLLCFGKGERWLHLIWRRERRKSWPAEVQLWFHPKMVPGSGVQVAAVKADSTWFLWNHSPVN